MNSVLQANQGQENSVADTDEVSLRVVKTEENFATVYTYKYWLKINWHEWRIYQLLNWNSGYFTQFPQQTTSGF